MKKDTQVNLGKAVQNNIEITHPDKVLFEKTGITKGDIAQYYLQVSGRMLPYLENRILSVIRCPNGIVGSCFYRKHPGDVKGIVKIAVPSSGGGTEEYGYLVDTQGLLSEVQMGTLEFHTWGSRVEALEHPDMMVLDLDPDEGMDLQRIRQGVKDLKSMLDQLSLTAYLKTSGGKGYHVVIPFKAVPDWERFHQFAKRMAESMEAAWPDRYTSDMRKTHRTGKIFIDWLRNTKGATTVAPYSVRAREGAPVSMPIAWEELDLVAPNGISMSEAVAGLQRKDPWVGLPDTVQQLK